MIFIKQAMKEGSSYQKLLNNRNSKRNDTEHRNEGEVSYKNKLR